jgi:hypothetical protein
MVRADPTLSRLCLVYDGYKKIVCEPLDSFYEALSSDAPRKHGLGPPPSCSTRSTSSPTASSTTS